MLLFYALCEKAKVCGDLESCREAIKRYTGEYFEGSEWLWAEPMREKLAKSYADAVFSLSEHLIDKCEFMEAEESLLRTYKNNPYKERTSELLLELYLRKGDTVKAVHHFQDYSRTLSSDLNVSPGKAILQKYTWIQHMAKLKQ